MNSGLSANSTLLASLDVAFERLKNSVTKEDARTFSSTAIRDVWESARTIERQLQQRQCARSLRRIEPLLHGLERYSKVIEVLCNGTPYLPWIWAPIKLMLQIAQENIGAFEKLVDAYASIGEAMPRFDKLAATFSALPEFQDLFATFYADILEFHRRAYKFLRRHAWQIWFDSMWKSFDSTFKAILCSLRRHSDLIDQNANVLHITESRALSKVISTELADIQHWRQQHLLDIEIQEKERANLHVREVFAWLGASTHQDDILEKYLQASRTTKSHWLFQNPQLLFWLKDTRQVATVWVNGKPGAGKSVICAEIIDYIRTNSSSTVLYYFCKSLGSAEMNHLDILRSIVSQILTTHLDLAPYILENFANHGQRATIKNLRVVLEKLLEGLLSTRIVLDGLDECDEMEYTDIIGSISGLQYHSGTRTCKLLIASRKIRSLSAYLNRWSTIRLDDNADQVQQTIARFVQFRVSNMDLHFRQALIEELEQKLLQEANGMFLWVQLIFSTLNDLYTEQDVRRTLATIPGSLPELYHRILERICGDGTTIPQKKAIRIIQWILVANRPLRRYEVESGIIFDENNPEITADNKLYGDVLLLCSPFLDVREEAEASIELVHFTAYEFLSRLSYGNTSPMARQLSLVQSHYTVALACILYLTTSLEIVDPRKTTIEIRNRIMRCHHELQFYANEHWMYHVQCLSIHDPDRTVVGSLTSLYDRLLGLISEHDNMRSLCKFNIDNVPAVDRFEELLDIERTESNACPLVAQRFIRTIKEFRDVCKTEASNSYINKTSKRRDPTLFSKIRQQTQTHVEALLELDESSDADILVDLKNFKSRHNTVGFLCPYPGCPDAHKGFPTSELRQTHENSHLPRFRCDRIGCGKYDWPFKTRSELERHIAVQHDTPNPSSLPNTITPPAVPKLWTNSSDLEIDDLPLRYRKDQKDSGLIRNPNATCNADVEMVHCHYFPMDILCISENLEFVAGIQGALVPTVYNVQSGNLVAKIIQLDVYGIPLLCFGFNNQYLIAAYKGPDIRVIEIAKPKNTTIFPVGPQVDRGDCQDLKFCAQTRYIAARFSDRFYVWNHSGTIIAIFTVNECRVGFNRSLSFSPDGLLLAVGSGNKVLVAEAPYSVIFAPSSREVIGVNNKGTIDLWKSSSQRRTFEGGLHSGDQHVAITSDSQWVLEYRVDRYGMADDLVIFWDYVTGVPVTQLRIHGTDRARFKDEDIMAHKEPGYFATTHHSHNGAYVRIWRYTNNIVTNNSHPHTSTPGT